MSQSTSTQFNVVSREEWNAAHAEMLAREKEFFRVKDELAAARRHAPMMEVGTDYEFDTPGGPASLVDVFEGRRQLILYSFMFPAGGTPCVGCSLFADQIPHLAHLHARDTTFAFIAPAPISETEPYRQRMGWGRIPWYSLGSATGFYEELGVGDGFALNVFLRDGDRVYRTYEISGRGTETLGSAWSFLDLTPMGRQEEWEDSPAWVPQTPPYEWWHRHDEYPVPA